MNDDFQIYADAVCNDFDKCYLPLDACEEALELYFLLPQDFDVY